MEEPEVIIKKFACRVYGIFKNGVLRYIGSTTLTLRRRFQYHKNDANRNDRTHCAIQVEMNTYGHENYTIELIEELYCTKEEMFEREGYYQKENIDKILNHVIIGRTREEYNEQYRNGPKREDYLQQKRDYRSNNKEIVENYRKEYYEKNKSKMNESINCVCGGSYVIRNIKKHHKTIKHTEYLKTLET